MGRKPTIRLNRLGRWLQKKRGTRSLEAIALRVRNLLKEQGVRFPSSALYRHEHGVPPPVPILYALAVVYQVDPSVLLTLVGQDLRLLALDPLEAIPMHSEMAEAVAVWFDGLTTDRQRNIVATLEIPIDPPVARVNAELPRVKRMLRG